MRDVKPEAVFDLDPLILPINEVHPNPRNARKHSPDQVEQIASSIREYGWTYPLLIDEKNVLIAGHGRLLAAQSMCFTHVPAFRIDHLSESQKRTLMIADNRLSEKAEWDLCTLALELTSLQEEGSLELTGWTADELSDIVAMTVPGSMEDIDEVEDPDEKSLPEQDDETAGWEKLHLKLPPETMQVFQDLMHRCRGKPHEQFEKMLSAVDVMALEELARTEARAKR